MDETQKQRQTSTTSPPSSGVVGSSKPPASRQRIRSEIDDILDESRRLYPEELVDVLRFVRYTRAIRPEEPTPELISELVATVKRVFKNYPDGVPISLVRASQPSTPRSLLDKAFFEAEVRRLIRLAPIQLPAPWAEHGAGILHERGLLYLVFPK